MSIQSSERPEEPISQEPTTPIPPPPPSPAPHPKEEAPAHSKAAAGIALIVLGAFALLGQLIPGSFWGFLFLPGLGVFFAVWGFLTREAGLLIPGGILLGVGVGAALVQGPFAHYPGNGQGGVIMLSMAGGFVLVTLFTGFLHNAHWWALIPAGILGVIGLGLVGESAGWDLVRYLNTAWPVALIIVGVFLILWRRGLQNRPPKS